MLTTLISFLGGSAFRMIWGEVSSYLTARQEHQHELQRMRLQADLEAEQHKRQQEAIRLQAELGVKVIEAQREADLDRLAAEGFNIAVEATSKVTGVRWVDAWNAAIRPGLATVSIVLVVSDAWQLVSLNENAWALAGAALGIYVADRTLFKRGK